MRGISDGCQIRQLLAAAFGGFSYSARHYWRGAKSFSQNDVEMSYYRHLDNYSDKPDLVHLHHWSSP